MPNFACRRWTWTVWLILYLFIIIGYILSSFEELKPDLYLRLIRSITKFTNYLYNNCFVNAIVSFWDWVKRNVNSVVSKCCFRQKRKRNQNIYIYIVLFALLHRFIIGIGENNVESFLDDCTSALDVAHKTGPEHGIHRYIFSKCGHFIDIKQEVMRIITKPKMQLNETIYNMVNKFTREKDPETGKSFNESGAGKLNMTELIIIGMQKVVEDRLRHDDCGIACKVFDQTNKEFVTKEHSPCTAILSNRLLLKGTSILFVTQYGVKK